MFKVKAWSFESGKAHHAVARAEVVSAYAAAELASTFPKSVLAKHGVTRASGGAIVGHWVEIRFSLAPTAGNDRNETGIRRYRTFRKHAAKCGFAVEFEVWNDKGWMTEDEFEAAIGE